jgi:hypothetical protein
LGCLNTVFQPEKREELRDTLGLPADTLCFSGPPLLGGEFGESEDTRKCHSQLHSTVSVKLMVLETKHLDTRLALRAIITPGGIWEA